MVRTLVQRTIDHAQQIRSIERFIHKVGCAPFERSPSNFILKVGGYEDDWHVRPLESDPAL